MSNVIIIKAIIGQLQYIVTSFNGRAVGKYGTRAVYTNRPTELGTPPMLCGALYATGELVKAQV